MDHRSLYMYVHVCIMCRSPMLFYDEDSKMLFVAMKVSHPLIPIIIVHCVTIDSFTQHYFIHVYIIFCTE